MPTEITTEPSGFHETIPSLRMTFFELVSILETIGIDAKLITANSNGAKFEGLDDIKSAPARFSGKPFVQFAKSNGDGSTSFANVEFDNPKTRVNAGKYKGYSAFDPNDNDLAKLIYEELIPFSRPSEFWIKRLSSWGTYLLLPVFLVGIFQFDHQTDSGDIKIGVYEFSPSIIWGFIFSYFALLVTDTLLKKRLPVVHNPRKTFWQRHGEATIVGIIGAVIAGLLIAYFTNK